MKRFILKNGSLNNKVYAFRERKWDLQSKTSIDLNNLYLKNIQLNLRNNNKKARILPLYNKDEKKASISDETRFSIHFKQEKELIGTVIKHTRKDLKSMKVNWSQILYLLRDSISLLKHKYAVAVIEKDADAETIISIKDLFSQFQQFFIVLDKNSTFLTYEKNGFLNKNLNKVVTFNLSAENKLKQMTLKNYVTNYDSCSLHYILGSKNNYLNNVHSKLIVLKADMEYRNTPANIILLAKSFFENSGTYTNLQGVVKKSLVCVRSSYNNIKSPVNTTIYLYA